MKILNEYYDIEDDNFSKSNIEDTRKNHLTLKHINKLRKRRAMHDLENQVHRERLQKIYGSSEGESGGLGI